MTILNFNVTIENENFALIKDVSNGRVYYGTIPHKNLDGDGCVIKGMNGFDMAISFTSPEDAINERRVKILFDNFRNEGHSQMEEIRYLLSLYNLDEA